MRFLATRCCVLCAVIGLGGLAANSTLQADEPPSAATQAPATEDTISLTVVGTLKTGIVAIGGETTGVTITAKGITFEVDFGDNQKLKAAAEALNGQRVTIRGALERRKGVERGDRWIVTATSLQAVGENGR